MVQGEKNTSEIPLSLITGELVLSTQTSVCVCLCVCVCSLCMHAFTNWPCHVFLEYLPRGLLGSHLLQGEKKKGSFVRVCHLSLTDSRVSMKREGRKENIE